MKISNSNSISKIQNEFNSLYPGLKLEFYTKSHDSNEPSPITSQLNVDRLIGEISTKTGELKIQDKMRVDELEQLFESEFGLHVQVFRKSKNVWLQTSTTDDWTLEVQNKIGLGISTF